MIKRCVDIYLLPLVILATGLTHPTPSAAQAVTPVITQEYFIQQAADEDLFITISAFEAEFESKISGPSGEVLLRSGIPGSRIVPLFQYISAPKSARQLDIEVTSSLHTGRTEFGIELTRLKPWDSRSSSVSQAYRLLSFGSETGATGFGATDSQANWTVKIDSLGNAARLFEQFGMLEMHLWAKYLVAHLIQFRLHDHSIVYSMTREILAGLKGARFQKIELATLQLQGLALIGLRRAGALSHAVEDPDPVQAVLARTAALADAMGYAFEQARALYASGVEYAGQSAYSQALEQFQLAVQIADSDGSAELATSIRESIVQIHTLQGDAPATSEVLQEIESQLVEEGGGDELALNLLAQAHLLMAGYRYGEAIEVLSAALTYENNSAIRTRINFELAKSFYESGRLEQSMSYLKLAEINPASAGKRRGNLVIDLAEGLRIVANIHRAEGGYEQMRAARLAQGQYQTPADQYLYDQGLDSLADPGQTRQQAMSFFRQAHTAAGLAGHADLNHLARLQYCALSGPDNDLCSRAGLEAAYDWLRNGAVPRFTAEAMLLWAQIQVAGGQRGAALATLARLIEEMHMLRHSLPGVLGAWYWERREIIFETWLGMLVTDSKQGGGSDDADSLLALSKIRTIEGYTRFASGVAGASAATDRLRDLLGQRADSAAGQSAFALNNEINAGLEKLRADFHTHFDFLTRTGLQKYLRSLGNDELLLTYHISPATAQVWIGQKGGVSRRDMANPARVYQALQVARQNPANIGSAAFNGKMDELGKRLLAPVADVLTSTIYMIPAGPLLGFPFDALRLNGHYLAERHSVVNLLSFPLNTNPRAGLRTGSLQKVFVAGNPGDYSGDYATRFETSAEIRSVADIFIGPGLQIVQGVALLPDEFAGEYFLEADLVHLSMPGVINLQFPSESGLELSESEYEPGRVVLRPQAIHTQKMSAGLVFLSSTRLAGQPLSDFSDQPGLVADFADAGAHCVIVNFWADTARSDETFIADFYRRLTGSGDIIASLRDARLQFQEKGRANDSYDWAGYQVFIR